MKQHNPEQAMKPEKLFYIGLALSLTCLAIGYWLAL